jgi:Mn2+/Fe2+ NRAMP family transporter|eukprot:CAMPEP_0169130474 /NCGR_PEP_ID=MMETSP1015-20121227/37721_1 /TAXON_ID=342587 /ORGANISM="Karlodinium micrum, Strain CCMP2283" /LENGTH=443 /DNA_ID=CAMNT_0009194647 /DNA_START=74 /DNA_END=1405 /DNA_ORIENTATION=+
MASHDAEAPPVQSSKKGDRSGELTSLNPASSTSNGSRGANVKQLLMGAMGPGLLVCLADTDAGCLLVASQSGYRFGYSLISLQILLIPVLYLVQELTVRLGVHAKKGHTACVMDRFGKGWGWISCALLVISCTGAIVSELSGVASVLELWGAGPRLGAVVAAISIVSAVMLCNYRQVEVFGIVVGLFELVFVGTMFFTRPSPQEIVDDMTTFHHRGSYWLLFSSNIGAVIMPWMIFFQQSAVVARRLNTQSDLQEERKHTLAGSVLTQVIMIGTMVTLAAAPKLGKDLKSIENIQEVLAPMFGKTPSMILLSLAFVGSALCGAVVVSLAAAWAICEAARWEDPFSMDRPISDSPRFYGAFLGIVAVGACIHLLGVNVVRLNVFIELIDSFLMPLVLCFLWLLVTGPLLPAEARVFGKHKVFLATLFTVVSVIAVTTGVYGILV